MENMETYFMQYVDDNSTAGSTTTGAYHDTGYYHMGDYHWYPTTYPYYVAPAEENKIERAFKILK